MDGRNQGSKFDPTAASETPRGDETASHSSAADAVQALPAWSRSRRPAAAPFWPPTAQRGVAHLVRQLYTQNPFYIISAGMIFWGLRASFNVGSSSFDTWALTLGLGGYTLLLAGTAILLIRRGKVWDDARSLLLLVVLMFLGISVTFDGALAADTTTGIAYSVGGWLFAIIVSEVLIFALRLRVPLLYRVPYHLLLALFFLYPASLATRLSTPESPALAWQLFGFSPAAALALLALLPAVRRGPNYNRDNGSPWPWPWYPWVLFGMLGLCASLRAYYLCLSLHFVGYSNSIFGPYFLMPLTLAAAILLLEAGVASHSALALRWAFAFPAAMIALASCGHRDDSVYRGFLAQFEHAFAATPLWIAVLAAAAFYLFALLRGVRPAGDALTAVLLALAFVGRSTLDLHTLVAPQSAPLALAGAWQLAVGLRHGTSARVLAGLCGFLAALTVVAQHTWFVAMHGLLPVHLLIVILLTVGYRYSDWFACRAQWAGGAMLVLCAVAVAAGDPTVVADAPRWLTNAYPLIATAALAVYGYFAGQRWCYAGALAAGSVWLATGLGRVYFEWRRYLIGLPQLAWGLIFFVVAALISVLKSRAWQRGREVPTESASHQK